jgi:hypothetical protein
MRRPAATRPSPMPVNRAPAANPRRCAGTTFITSDGASTISRPPVIPETRRQEKNQVKQTGQAQASSEATVSSMAARTMSRG